MLSRHSHPISMHDFMFKIAKMNKTHEENDKAEIIEHEVYPIKPFLNQESKSSK